MHPRRTSPVRKHSPLVTGAHRLRTRLGIYASVLKFVQYVIYKCVSTYVDEVDAKLKGQIWRNHFALDINSWPVGRV